MDYQLIGHATHFVVPVTIHESRQFKPGCSVLLIGDSVDPVEATVLSVSDSLDVEVEIVSH